MRDCQQHTTRHLGDVVISLGCVRHAAEVTLLNELFDSPLEHGDIGREAPSGLLQHLCYKLGVPELLARL